MRLKLITGPTAEALHLDDVKKSALRVYNEDDDYRISRLIVSAREAFENFANRILLSSTWDLYLDAFADVIELIPPATSVTNIKYQDSSDVQQTLAITYYVTDFITEPARITLAYGQSWPSTYGELNDVVIRFVAGYANAAAVPEGIKQGMMLHIQEAYDGTDRTASYEALWWPYRIEPI